MNKKFLSAILFGALMVTSTGTFVSCKDYDDDIDNINKELSEVKASIASLDAAIKSGKWVSSYAKTSNGYTLTLSDGSTLELLNGTDGEKGDKGDTGLQGIQGPAGESVIPTFRVNSEYWQYSVDNGTTWVDVKDAEGNKVKAKGEDGKDATANVTWENGYIKIGGVLTDLKAENKFPTMVVDENTKTIAVTVDGQAYTLLLEGSVFNGLQTIVYRRQAQDDQDDVVKAYYLVHQAAATNEDTLMIPAVATASFKVYPGDWNPSNAQFNFIDTYRTRAAVPSIKYVDGSAKVSGNILTLRLQPSNFDGYDTNVAVDETNYATSLDVTMYNQYTSASDYFNVQVERLDKDNIWFHETPANEMGDYQYIDKSQQQNAINNAGSIDSHFMFEYNGTYNLNDSIDMMITAARPVISLKDLGYEYTIEYSLSNRNWNGDAVDNGIFELKDGVLSVKKQYQSSSINEYAYVLAKCTIKSQVEGVADMVMLLNLAVQAGHTTQYGNVELSLNSTIAGQSWNLLYSAKPQYLVLDTRKFEAEMGGRDLFNSDRNNANSWLMPLFADYVTGAESVSADNNDDAYSTAANSKDVKDVLANISSGEIALYFKAAPNNSATSLDSLFLLVGPNTKLDAAKLWMAAPTRNTWNSTAKGTRTSVNGSGIIRNYVYINDMSIVRTPLIDRKSATYTEMIVGKYVDAATVWEPISDNMFDVYSYTPADMKVRFALAPANSQNDYVKALMAGDGSMTPKIEFDNVNNKIVITSAGTTGAQTVEVSKIGNILLNAYDLGTDWTTFTYSTWNPTTMVNEIGSITSAQVIATTGARTWTVQNPYKAFAHKASGNFGDKTYTDNTLANNSTYNSYTDAIHTNTVKLQDAYGKDLVTTSATTPFLKVSDYAKNVYGFTGVFEFSFDGSASADAKADWNLNTTTGVLTCIKQNVGAGYKITIPVKVTFPSKFGRPSMVIKVTIKNAAN